MPGPIRFKETPPGQTSLPGAFLLGGKIMLVTMAAMMVVPLVFDIYHGAKNWLLYEPEQSPPPGL